MIIKLYILVFKLVFDDLLENKVKYLVISLSLLMFYFINLSVIIFMG